MSSFTALNVELEDTVEEEVDDTKEIQLEEAFKLYQNALKLHSQGSDFFQEARDAYKELLQSDVFKYPEVVSDFAHDELDEEVSASAAHHDTGALALLPSNATESSASSIPQLLYLAFKNRGQFILDVARHQLSDKHGPRVDLCRYYAKACTESIGDFAKALERDDTDLDLWKKSARVAEVLLSTQRITRFCLESVLAGDDDDTSQAIDLSGLDEAFAAGELEEVVNLLEDDLTRLGKPEKRPRSQLLMALRRTNDPYPYLPKRTSRLEYVDDRYRPLSFGGGQVRLKITSGDLNSLGEVINQTIQAVHGGDVSFNAATSVHVELPEGLVVHQDRDMPDSRDISPSHDPTSVSQNLPSSVSIALVNGNQVYESPSGEKEPPSERNAQHQDTRSENAENTIEVATQVLSTADELRNSVPPTSSGEPGSRKRSTAVAGNEEPEGRTKSKRLRARESMADLAAQEDEATHDDPQYFLDQLAFFEQTDQAMFDVVNSMLAKIDLQFYLSTEEAKQAFWQSSTNGTHHKLASDTSREDLILLADLRTALLNWTDEKGHAIISGHGHHDFAEKSTGMSLFLQHSRPTLAKGMQPATNGDDSELIAVADLINAQPSNIYDATLIWLSSLLISNKDDRSSKSLYLRQPWSTQLRHTLNSMLCIAHAQIYETLRQCYFALEGADRATSSDHVADVQALFGFVQSWFELHLDHHSAIMSPSSDVPESARSSSETKLLQSASLANDVMHLHLGMSGRPELDDPLIVRFIWASAICATLSQDVDKAHVLLCLQDLKALLQKSSLEVIHLPNSTAMPVISTLAIDQEVSRLSTLDFFTNVFDTDNSNPVAVIEKLEPILEPRSILGVDERPESSRSDQRVPQMERLIQFLEAGDASLKLFLWRRLQNAYIAISYTPKVISCLLRAIETSVHELFTTRHLDSEFDARQTSMLKWLRDTDELMVRLLPKALSDNSAFECVDDAHLRSSLKAVTSLTRILHGFVIYEDSVRVGQTAPPQLRGAASSKLFEKSKDRLREMLVRTCLVQYLLLKEATVQHPSSFGRAADDLAEYLSTVHNCIGIRQYCKYANKAFVKLVKAELCTLSTQQDYTTDMTQVFFDLYQLRFTSGVGDTNHGCPTENLDRKTAWSLVPTIMTYAAKYNIKDLAKGELRTTIDKIQSALGAVKSLPPLMYNKRIISSYLKSPIKSDDLYRCIRGLGDLPTRHAESDTEIAARNGWYFLLGHMSLAKYKSIKRVSPTPTDDLDTAASLFRQDLDHNINKWETWYRLAQVYEAKIEDDLIWNSTKLNDSRGDIALLERQAIHSYVMATAIAMRLPETVPDDALKIENMLAEFATRLYASSRPPLNMEAFRTDKHMRHMSSRIDMTMSKQAYHPPVGSYALWKFAAYLLSRKFSEKPKHWTTHYTRCKCLWKMFTSPENRTRRRPVTAEEVVEAITEAIEALPKKEKSNEPILEPHFKLVSIVHKLVTRRAISYTQGEEYLQATRYAQGIHLSEYEDGAGPEWVPYMLDILKKLGNADKSNWHHRIIDRAAHVIYDESPGIAGALGAKHQFTQQIFTKTMTIQVWKPENERPGRHYVYTGRYVAFFVHVLEQLNDRMNLDQLVRRIRRKTTDFLDHTKVWEAVTTVYVRLLRRHGKIPDGRERALFDGMNHEEFTKKSEKMEAWALDPDTTSVFLDIMRDGIDLKRLNNSLMKGPLIDDLIGDAYACLYEEFVAQLPPEEQPPAQPAPFPQGTFINMTADLAPSNDGDTERGRLNTVLRAQGDGTAELPLALSVSAPIGLGLQGSSKPLPGGSGQAMPEVPRVPGKPGRTKTVTRREIQRKAEAAIAKPPPIKTPILSKRPNIEVVLRDDQADSSPINPKEGDAKERTYDSRASSRRGSMRDSADGENDTGSELSDLDDLDDEKKQLFSELERANERAEDADGDEGGDDGEDDGGDDGGDEGADDDGQNDSLDEQNNDDEEMEDPEDEADGEVDGEGEGEGEMEIQDSQENLAGDSPEDEQEEFHEAREQND
ncbi:uncharacterized protein A1O9_02289 [Exophiala aquamarina CBS 119918]|uniref:Histone transcription regulator 3 homolog n=1 Tax=Exophiala aquamarina CBS 119918 TaxID=1182545 RepID=A0A072PN22_9EURO|nr:uncharacterized protein A1O9_02289 [Exophiala aquamarina CBS 119918]KEF60728.1 hypothetical protein A1O9_02289 [Exophiala aquamarina CBS 119918]